MSIDVALASLADVTALREDHRAEMRCQIVHDSLSGRGWARTFLLTVGGDPAGFGSVAIAGPWKDRPTIFEFYVRPERRGRAFELFEALREASAAQFFAMQTNDTLLNVMLLTYGREFTPEAIVFRDELATTWRVD